MSSSGVARTSLQLYRDCLRLMKHVAPGQTAKSQSLRLTLNSSFLRNAHLDPVADEDKVEAAKADAVRALANYVVLTAAIKDKSNSGLRQRSEEFLERERPKKGVVVVDKK
jgi:hypothetical protein